MKFVYREEFVNSYEVSKTPTVKSNERIVSASVFPRSILYLIEKEIPFRSRIRIKK